MLVAVTIKVVYRFTTIRGDADARQYPWCPSAKWAMMHDGDWFRNDPQVRLIALTKVKRYGDDKVMADGMEMDIHMHAQMETEYEVLANKKRKAREKKCEWSLPTPHLSRD